MELDAQIVYYTTTDDHRVTTHAGGYDSRKIMVLVAHVIMRVRYFAMPL